MMTEKEYDELYETRELTEKLTEFWGTNLETLTDAIRGLEDFYYLPISEEKMPECAEDEKIKEKFLDSIVSMSKAVEKRAKYWSERHDEADNELNSLEAQELLESLGDGEPFEPYDADAGFGLNPFDNYDYAASGMGI